MTAATAEPTSQPAFSGTDRVLAAARLSTVAFRGRVLGAWLILAAIFIVHQAIWWVIRANAGGEPNGFTGALSSFYFIVASTYLALMTQVMPFGLSLGITRRHFYLGTTLLVAAETLLSAVFLTLLLQVERWTGGWGLQVQFFEMFFMGQPNLFLQVLAYWVPLMTISFAFVAIGAVFRRWGQFGVWAVCVGLLVVVAAIVMYFTWQDAWLSFGMFFVETPTILLLAGYPLILAALSLVGGYLVLRRAQP
ncbi:MULTISPECIES: hypothetical protein [Pseudonocardia]|uniref:ABC-2 family transporter protein n=2 Tax=Pseudonocardia TaxID=1847 RepID=A0A1Y2MTR3_PSEAH|nr:MULTISPECIES: hypothetical protein [Pseudonocardia]OSY38157.1 hypothetical protein BG845_04330 [Pseudonocardia autotrophica]TDN75597.1 hypothetical protein C8E95_4775 [Pseudonocardia autotrophica]BBF99568.1 hypothetical protein Pdca_07780 [Pseudonocardia autotrophica]GEC27807.1 hypothetical protein PSA01_48360 [Pseudonocardia saturnea]